MPWVIPPCTCPSTISGLITVPTSSTATYRTRRASPRLGVDLDDRRVGSARPREVRRVVGRRPLEPGLHALREVVRHPRPTRRPRRASFVLSGEPFTAERPVRELEVVGRHLELVGDDLAGLLDHLVGRHAERRRCRSRGSGCRTCRGPGGRSTCRRGAPRPRRCRSRAGRRRSAPTSSRGPGRGATCR